MDDSRGTAGDGTDRAEGPAAPAPAVVSRRRWLFVGSVLAALAGMGTVVGVLWLFPGLPPVVPFGAGMAVTAVLFAVLYAGLFARR